LWNTILSNILKVKLFVVKDYESEKKPIKDLYLAFKREYKIPKNLLDHVIQCKYLQRFYSPQEIKEYYEIWLAKSVPDVIPYTDEQYKLYEQITMENCHLDYIQKNHYMDEGCRCNACNVKRREIAQKIFKGMDVTEKVRHLNAKKELMGRRVASVNALNNLKQSHKMKINKL
jgi:hypothetical protein